MCLDALECAPNEPISTRTHKSESENTGQTYTKSIAFSNPAGQKLLVLWERTPPVAPTKYLDYKIAKVLAQITRLSATEIVNDLLPLAQVEDLRIASFALLYLRFQMFGKIKKSRNPMLIPMETHYETLKATDLEIEESQKIGRELYAQIEQDVQTHVQNLTISGSYFLGLHIGDGGLGFSTFFSPDHQSFKARFTWNLTDCLENEQLLKAVKEFLQSRGIHFRNFPFRYFETYLQLYVTGVQSCLQLVDLFDALGAEQHFSEARLNQYRCFSQAIRLYTNPSFRRDWNMCYRFLQLKWEMNPGTTNKREGSFADDVAKLELWFYLRRRN